jgi:protocatechuate 3,4-dioxygenase beta subunit
MRRNKATLLWMCSVVVTAVFFANHAVAEETKEITCTVTVVDAECRPISGARVSLYQMEYNQATNIPESKPISKVITEADGIFLFKVSAESDVYRYGYITTEKAGLAIGFANWRMRLDQELEIKLGQAKQLEGIVVDQSDKPISSAQVSIWSLVVGEGRDQQNLSWPVAAELLTSTTDHSGRFIFTNIPAEATADFIIKKSGRATINTYRSTGYANQKMTFAPGQTDIKLVLPNEARIEGTVKAKDTGEPIAGVNLIVMQQVNRPIPGQGPVSTKKDGTFTVNALPAGSYQVQLVRSRETPSEWVAEPEDVTLEAGQTITDVQMELSKGGILEVHITDAKTKRPVEKAQVNVYTQKTNMWIYGTSDANGVALVRLMPGAYQFRGIYMRGYKSEELQEAFTIEYGGTKRLNYQLTSMPKINGVVRDENGKPVEGAKIVVCPVGFEEICSDKEGNFEISWDPGIWGARPRETTFWLVARHQERNLAAVDETMTESTNSLTVNLKPGVVITGRIVDPNGKGISGANFAVMLDGPGWGSSVERERLSTDENGKYEIGAIPSGHSYSINASADGYGSNRVKFHTDDAKDNRLSLEPLTLAVANLSVSGRIVDMEGNPVANARIESYDFGHGQPSHLSTQADAQGGFILKGVCEGEVNIRISAVHEGKHVSAQAITNGGATGIKIIAREGRSVLQYLGTKTYEQIIQDAEKVIAGVALDESGSPVVGVPVGVCCHKKKRENDKFTWMFSSFTDLKATTDQQGRFAIELKEDGEYNLLFSPDHHAAIIVYDIPVGRKDLKVTLSEGGTVVGRLVRMDRGRKVAIPNVEVKIEQPDRASYTHLGFDRDRTTVTDAEGRFRFEYLRTKIRPHESMSKEQWEYVPRVWEIRYGDTSKTIAFYDSTTIEDFEMVVKPKLTDAQSLLGDVVPEFDDIKIDLSINQIKDSAILVCFFDMNQRPSRNAVIQLSRQEEQLKQKGIVIVAIQVSKITEGTLNKWVKEQNISFPVGIVGSDEEETRFTWGVKSLPWLILTNRQHIFIAEGFNLDELEDKIKTITEK